MKNPLLVPELREMLESRDFDEIREFCDATQPTIAAEFLGGLTPQEDWDILASLAPEARAMIFSHFDEDVRLKLIELLKDEDLADLIVRMPDEERFDFLKQLPREKQRTVIQLFDNPDTANGRAVLLQLASILEAEEEPLTAEEIASEIIHEVEIYKLLNNKVERVNRVERGCWINIVNPSKETLPLIAEHFKIPADFLTASLDIDETARIEIEDNATLMIVKVPYFDEHNPDVLYFTLPIGVILNNGFVITVCAKEDSILRDFVANRVKNVTSVSGHKFVLQIFLRATVLYLQYLKQINNAANIIQKKLEQESKNKQLIKLLNIEKSLVYFTTSLKTNALMFERLNRLRLLQMDEENENLLEDIVTEGRQAIEMANIYSDILSGMMDAFASVISNNLNIVMKILTSITIIITIPVLVASFYGMNVRLPLQGHPYAFLLVILASFVLAMVAIVFFIKKKWLEP